MMGEEAGNRHTRIQVALLHCHCWLQPQHALCSIIIDTGDQADHHHATWLRCYCYSNTPPDIIAQRNFFRFRSHEMLFVKTNRNYPNERRVPKVLSMFFLCIARGFVFNIGILNILRSCHRTCLQAMVDTRVEVMEMQAGIGGFQMEDKEMEEER